MSISKRRFAVKERQQQYEEKRLAVKRLSDEVQAMENGLDPKSRSAANNPRQLPEYFKIIELLKTPTVTTLEGDLLPLLASIVKLAPNSEATAPVGEKAALILDGFKNWLKLLRHFVDPTPAPNPEAKITVESLLGKMDRNEAENWLARLFRDLKELSSEQRDLSQSDHSLSAHLDVELDEAGEKEGDRKKFEQRSQMAREILRTVEKKLTGVTEDGSVLSVEAQVHLELSVFTT